MSCGAVIHFVLEVVNGHCVLAEACAIGHSLEAGPVPANTAVLLICTSVSVQYQLSAKFLSQQELTLICL